jgi:hypothetical protein
MWVRFLHAGPNKGVRMSKVNNLKSGINKVTKRTCQGGKVKTSSMSKSQKRSFKRYNGQGR